MVADRTTFTAEDAENAESPLEDVFVVPLRSPR
jgi:hypothetical protein